MNQAEHAKAMADRFRNLIEDAGDTLADRHYGELALLIESGLDTVLTEQLNKVSDKLENLSRDLKQEANYFD